MRILAWRTAVAGLVIAAGLVTVIAQTAAWWWPGDLCCHWTLHTALVLTIGSIVWRKNSLVSRTCMILLLIALVPWVRQGFSVRAERAEHPLITIDWANIYRYNEHRTEALDLLRTRHADLVGLAEVVPDDRQILAADSRWPFQVWVPTDSVYACALLSKRRIVSHSIVALDGNDTITAIIDMGDTPLRVIVVHLSPPMSPALLRRRHEQMKQLVVIANQQDLPTLVMGDFNTTSASTWWYPCLSAAGLLTAPGFTPATWPAWSSPWARCPGITIDHLLTRYGRLAPAETFWIPGSDHLGLHAAWEPLPTITTTRPSDPVP